MSVSTLYPDSKPTFKVNFKKSKRLPSKFTFTRSSTGTYTDRNGLIQTAAINKPRFDHDPLTGECKGLLIEEARTNLLLRSEEFDQSPWATSNATVTPNQAIAPDGTTTADLLTKSAAFGTVYQLTNVANLATHTFSVYIKKETNVNAYLFVSEADASVSLIRALINLDTGVVTSVTGSTTAVAVGNGWYRVYCTFTYTNALNRVYLYPGLSSDTSTGGIYIWGAQLEAGAFPTSYIPTTSTTATREIDQCTVTGTNFSKWYNQVQGAWSIAYQGINNVNVNTRRAIEVGVAGSTLNRHIIGYQNTTGSRLLIVSEGVSQVDNTQPATQGNLISVAYGYTANNVYHKVNLEAGALDTVATIPNSINALAIGFDFISSTGTCLCGYIIKLIYWPQRITNTNIENLTRS